LAVRKKVIDLYHIFSSNVKYIFILGELCRTSLKSNQKYVCTATRHCKAFKESIRTHNYLDICKFVGLQPIVCCPVTMTIEIVKYKNAKRSISADESMNMTYYQIYILFFYIYVMYLLMDCNT